MTTKGRRRDRGNKNDNNDPPPALLAAAAPSELDPVVPLGLGGKESAATSASYDKLVFSFFARGSLLVLILFHQRLYQQGRIGPGGGATFGWWQGREVSGPGSVEGEIWRN